MTFSTKTLVYVAQQLLIYGGMSMILIGMFSSLMVVSLFSRKPFSESPCSIYLIINGILSFFFLPLYYFPIIMIFGLQIDWLSWNGSFCKFEMSYAAFTITSVFLINCFISFDRYVISSRSARIRSLSSKKICRYFVSIGLILSWLLIGMPVAILFENVPLSIHGPYICTSRSTAFLLFAAFFYYPILEGVLPIALAIYFRLMIRRQVQTLNNEEFLRRFDKQMSRMYFAQIVLHAVSSVPFASINLYRALTIQTIKSETTQDLIQFFRLLGIFLFYLQYSTDFYVYFLTSPEIRVQTKNFLCFYRQRWTNRVIPVQTQTRSAAKTEKINTIQSSLNKH